MNSFSIIHIESNMLIEFFDFLLLNTQYFFWICKNRFNERGLRRQIRLSKKKLKKKKMLLKEWHFTYIVIDYTSTCLFTCYDTCLCVNLNDMFGLVVKDLLLFSVYFIHKMLISKLKWRSFFTIRLWMQFFSSVGCLF